MNLYNAILNLESLLDSARAKNSMGKADKLVASMDTALGILKNLPTRSNIYMLVSEYFNDDRAKELSKIIFERIRNVKEPEIIT